MNALKIINQYSVMNEVQKIDIILYQFNNQSIVLPFEKLDIIIVEIFYIIVLSIS